MLEERCSSSDSAKRRTSYSVGECGPTFALVLIDEVFSGFRYLKGGWPLTTPGSPHETSRSNAAFPKLAVSNGISLGSSVAQLRAAYRVLHLVGADSWRSPNGLVFVDDAKPVTHARLRHIVEIKAGTCGDF